MCLRASRIPSVVIVYVLACQSDTLSAAEEGKIITAVVTIIVVSEEHLQYSDDGRHKIIKTTRTTCSSCSDLTTNFLGYGRTINT